MARNRQIFEPPFETHTRVHRLDLLMLVDRLLKSIHRGLLLLLELYHLVLSPFYLLLKIPNFASFFILNNCSVHLKHEMIDIFLSLCLVHLPDLIRSLRGVL